MIGIGVGVALLVGSAACVVLGLTGGDDLALLLLPGSFGLIGGGSALARAGRRSRTAEVDDEHIQLRVSGHVWNVLRENGLLRRDRSCERPNAPPLRMGAG